MNIGKTFHARSRADWRKWLSRNHGSKDEIWLVLYKKHTGKPSLSYDEAVEEALCFGWIDSTGKRIDHERCAQRYSPRRNTASWSVPNIRRLHRLIDQGLMTPAGLAKIDKIPKSPPPPEIAPRRRRLVIPADIKKALSADRKAWGNFVKLAKSYRRYYVGWIAEAKRPETRQRRLLKSIECLRLNKKSPMA